MCALIIHSTYKSVFNTADKLCTYRSNSTEGVLGFIKVSHNSQKQDTMTSVTPNLSTHVQYSTDSKGQYYMLWSRDMHEIENRVGTSRTVLLTVAQA